MSATSTTKTATTRHTNDCVRQRAKFGARSKAGDVCSCDADAEQPSDLDAERIADLENEGLTHSDAVGVMEAEKLAWQAEPAAGEWWAMLTQGERDYFIRSAWSLPKASHDAARIAAGENASLEKNNEPHWQISGYTESSRLDGQRVVRVTAPHPDGGGFDVAEVLESEASMVVAAVNVHTQLVAALESVRAWLIAPATDETTINQMRAVVNDALRLACTMGCCSIARDPSDVVA